jgi:hypothetical protein
LYLENQLGSGWGGIDNFEKFRKNMMVKVDMILDAMEHNNNKIIVYSDVDVQFFGKTEPIIKEMLETNDLVIQQDRSYDSVDHNGAACAGFYALNVNYKTKELFKRMQKYLKIITDKNFKYTGKSKLSSVSDQKTLNFFLQVQENDEIKKFKHVIYPDAEYNIKDLIQNLGIKWSFLPAKKFCGGGTHYGLMWEWKKFNVDREIIMHHANYCFSEVSKIEQLRYVRDKFNELDNIK